jgi:hypothetical protein
MYNSTVNLCEEKHWRERRRQLLSARGYQEQDNAIVSLPLPSFSPSLDFDPHEFTLPPPYTATADVEKALHTTHPQGTFESDASTLCPTIAFSDALFPKPRYVQESHPVPTRRHVRVIRYVRFTLFTVYRRLFTLVILLNLAGVYVLLQKLRIDTLGILASSNFLLAILVRQDYLVNTLFRTAWLVPWAVPLGLRRAVARVYCYGGIHSGAAVAGTIWWFGFTVVSTIRAKNLVAVVNRHDRTSSSKIILLTVLPTLGRQLDVHREQVVHTPRHHPRMGHSHRPSLHHSPCIPISPPTLPQLLRAYPPLSGLDVHRIILDTTYTSRLPHSDIHFNTKYYLTHPVPNLMEPHPHNLTSHIPLDPPPPLDVHRARAIHPRHPLNVSPPNP